MESLNNNQKRNYIFSFLKFMIILLKIKNILLDTCEYDTPIIKSNKCTVGECKSTDFENNKCTINNTLIKTQWFNNFIPVSSLNHTYVDITTTLNGNLLVSTSSHPKQNNSRIYGLKKMEDHISKMVI